MFGLDASGVKLTLPVLVNIPRWVALPEPVGSAPITLPLPSRIGIATPVPLSEKGRSVAVTARLPASSVSVSTRNLTDSERFMISSPSNLVQCAALRSRVALTRKTSHVKGRKNPYRQDVRVRLELYYCAN